MRRGLSVRWSLQGVGVDLDGVADFNVIALSGRSCISPKASAQLLAKGLNADSCLDIA